ncbi:hypothetical protein VTJ49DRAFT_4597 [Mycothermus thermophilus]|uniref:Uncharacterized protein n=1 Tax=Humicola insolens TaxID=85995 RepID=A0ABR3V508_HUMIN
MDLRTLLFLAAAVATGSCSPVQPGAARGAPPVHAVAPREALNLGGLAPQDTVIINPLPPTPGCTTTIRQTYSYPCSWDGTTTIYPSTTVQYQPVNCNGCQNVHIIQDLYHCPNMRINGTRFANTPSTYLSTICRPSLTVRAQGTEMDAPATTTADPNPNRQTHAAAVVPNQPTATALPTLNPQHEALKLARNPAAAAIAQPQDPQATACATTLVVQPPRSAGRTATIYSSWTTSTHKVPCGGCDDLVVSTALAGYGPPTTFETTTTLPVGTVTAYACGLDG